MYNKIIKALSLILIIMGSFLEIQYYKIRFEMDNIETWLAIVISITLTLFLCLAVLNRKTTQTKILVIALIIYSVLATSAGQSFSLSLLQKQEVSIDVKEEYIKEEMDDLKYQIKQINEKYNKIQEGINETIGSLHDRGLYRTTLKDAENRQEQLTYQRTILDEKLSKLRSKAVSHETVEKKETNIYLFYNNLTGVPAKWLQFIFQTILSIFIAIMAPLGISIIQSKKSVPVEKKPKLKKTDWKPLVERWVHTSWVGKRTGKSNNILQEPHFMEFNNSRGYPYTKEQYKKIKEVAINTKCIDSEKIIINESEAIRRILEAIG